MFALKIVLKNVQMADISFNYIDSAIVDKTGKRAMLLGTKVAFDLFSCTPIIDYLKTNEGIIRSTNIRNQKNETFATWLFTLCN